MKIKFCGIRRLEDVAFCNELQPEYLGMILSSGFRRTISPETAEQLVKAKAAALLQSACSSTKRRSTLHRC